MSGNWNVPDRDESGRVEPKAHVRRSSGARRAAIAVAGVLAAVLVVAVIAYATDMFPSGKAGAEQPPPQPPTSQPQDDKAGDEPLYPVDGRYQIRVEHSGMCLGAGPEQGDEQRAILVQQPCEAAWPDLELTEIKDGRFRMVLKYGDNGWEKCLGVEDPGSQPDANFTGYDCAKTELQAFQLKPLTGGFYQIRIPAGELCMAIKERSAERGAAVTTTKCDAKQGSQRFEILPA